MDSGLRSGPNIAAALASGADFTFLGRLFMYGVAALGARGPEHTINSLNTQLEQILNQPHLPNQKRPTAALTQLSEVGLED